MNNLQPKKLIFVVIILFLMSLLLYSVDILTNIVMNKFSISNFLSDRDWQKAESNYDVIVVGGEPEGISAAVCAARSGGKALLLSYEDGLGGLMTYGMLNSIDMNRNSKNQLVTKGVFVDFYNGVGGDSFDVKKAKQVFEKMVKRQKNITYISGTGFVAPIIDKNIIKGVKIKKNGVQKDFYAKRVIDATPDADVVTSAGAPYTLGQEDIGLKDTYMCATLVFRVKGVSWQQLADDIRQNLKTKKVKDEGINKRSAWGFGDIRKEYKPLHDNMKMRGLNIGKQDDGSVLINALQIVNIDLLNEDSRKKAIEEGAEEAKNITLFIKKKIPSFSGAEFAGVADSLYIRETRHVKGEYILKTNDILNNRDFDDKIAVASYPVDIQATGIKDMGTVICTPDQYGIPLRCLVPLKVENAFVVGRSASYTSVSAGSARVIPVGMVAGQAAGVAAVYSIKHKVTPRQAANDISIVKEIQETLKKQGAYLPDFNIPNKNTSHWAYPDIEKLSSIGIGGGGYNNNYRFNEQILKKDFIKMMLAVVKRRAPDYYDESMEEALLQMCPDEKITKDSLAQILLYICDKKVYNKNIAWEAAKKRGLLGKEFINRMQGESFILREQAFNEAVYFIENFTGKSIEI